MKCKIQNTGKTHVNINIKFHQILHYIVPHFY